MDAAADGDILLIRAGSYAGFDVDGKSLQLIGDAGALVTIGSPASGAFIRIQNLPAAASVTLRNLSVAANVQFFSPAEDVSHAIQVQNSTSVTLVRCDAEAHIGSEGLLSTNSKLFVFESLFEGGVGRSDLLTSFVYAGGHGARLISGELFSMDSTFTGGTGFDASPFSCHPASDGGSGVQVDSGVFRDRTNSFSPGVGGTGGPCGVPDGLDGSDIDMGGGALEQFTETAQGVVANSPVYEGQLASQTYYGAPSEVIFVLIGFSLEPGVFLPDFVGPSLVGAPSLTRFFGLLNASGMKTKSFTVNELGFDAVTA